MSKIYTVGFDVNIIDFLVDSLLKRDMESNACCKQSPGKGAYDFSSIALVTPGRRPQFYLRKALAGRIHKPFFPPRIFSIEDFIQYLAKKSLEIPPVRDEVKSGGEQQRGSCQPISLTDACFLIYKIVQNLQLSYLDWQKQLEFEHFFLWARRIFQFLEELDKELVSERQLLNLQENAQIGLPLPNYINQLLENINQIHRQFHSLLEENNLASLGFNYYRVAQAIDRINLSEYSKIYFVGFFALNACEKKIIKHLLDKELAVLIWQRDDDKWSIFEELEEFFAISPERIDSGVSSSVSKDVPNERYPQIQIFEGFDIHSQMESVRRILLNIKDLDDTCIVLPQAQALMPLLYQALPANLTDYNISLGYPLRNTPIYALMDTIMQSQERRRQDGSFYTKDYLKVIMHPYIKNIGDEQCKSDMTRILVHKVEEALLGIDKRVLWQKKAFAKLEEIEENSLIFQIAAGIICDSGPAQIQAADLREKLKLIHQKFLYAFDSCKTVFDYVEAIQAMIDFILEKSQVFSDIFSGESFNRFLSILDNLRHSLFRDEAIRDKIAFFELLKVCLYFENIPFLGTPVGGLQILGLLETRNLKFSSLIILSLNEGVLPRTDKAESLVPEGIFPALGLPHYHKREEIMRYHFRRLVGGAKNVFLIYAACSRNSESRSRFIEEIIWQKEKRDGRLYDAGKIRRIEFKVMPVRQEFSLAKTPQAISMLRDNIFSPTSLDTYLHCPAKFYFRYCLGLKEKEEITEELEASEIGNFLHCLFRDFYALFLNKTVRLDEQAHEYLFELKGKKLKEFFPQQTGEQFILSRIIDYKLKVFLSQEARRKEKIKILYLEKTLPVAPERINIETEYGAVFLKGKLDRVDERIIEGKKHIVVLDYKTGEYSLPKKNINQSQLINREQIKKAVGSFQLPLYVYLLSKSQKIYPSMQVNASFYSLRDIKEEFLFGGNDYKELLELYLDALRRILAEVLCPDCDFVRDDSDDYYCRWCPFPALCKR